MIFNHLVNKPVHAIIAKV